MTREIKKSEILLRRGMKWTNKEIADSLNITTKELTQGLKFFGLISSTDDKDNIAWTDDVQLPKQEVSLENTNIEEVNEEEFTVEA
jgi:DNA-directed RNA polymerase specialized sigma subunit